MERTLELRGLRENGVRKLSAALFTGSLALTALAGCGDGSNTSEISSNSQAPTATEVPSSVLTTQSGSEHPPLVFDDLHGGSSIIRVYPGVTESANDKESNGTFNDGDIVPAECKTEGRTVHSDPSVGEEDRTSSEWIRIHGTPGETQFATAVYVKSPSALLKKLPNC
jgi:hypothetical protein